MQVRVGITTSGQVAGFDTCSARPLLLVGDGGRGKTTVARYLTRWWLADTVRHAHVYAGAPSEWADLACELLENLDCLERRLGGGCASRKCLVVVDDLDHVDDRLGRLPRGAARTILTSHGGHYLASRALLGTDPTCWGLVHAQHADLSEAAVLDGQGRLDWPFGTVAVIPDQRGPMDFPCHRWQVPADRWMVAAR